MTSAYGKKFLKTDGGIVEKKKSIKSNLWTYFCIFFFKKEGTKEVDIIHGSVIKYSGYSRLFSMCDLLKVIFANSDFLLRTNTDSTFKQKI